MFLKIRIFCYKKICAVWHITYYLNYYGFQLYHVQVQELCFSSIIPIWHHAAVFECSNGWVKDREREWIVSELIYFVYEFIIYTKTPTDIFARADYARLFGCNI